MPAGPINPAFLVGFLVFVVIGFTLGVAIGAVILRAAISLYNKSSGGSSNGNSGKPAYPTNQSLNPYDQQAAYGQPKPFAPMPPTLSAGIPEPSFPKAMGIIAVAGIVNAVVSFLVGFVIGLIGGGAGVPMQGIQLVAQLVSLVTGFFTMSLVVSGMLPTTFGRAALVTLYYFLICIAIAIGIVVVVFGIGFLLSM